MTTELKIPFDNSYARLPDKFYARVDPTPVRAPKLICYNAALAEELRLPPDLPDSVLAAVFSGNQLPPGAEPLAQAYSGHQFGGFSPQLGDGRACLLGEVIDRHGNRRDIQLKGSGPTPWSRRGDGRAWLGPVLREYLVSEAMHALGIPTSRALAATTTGEPVYREPGALPGAVLTRVAASHIRVGTFQYFAARRDKAALEALCDHVIARHFPHATSPGAMLQAVIDRQSALIAAWMSVGFIHGVMNTDNTAISGETIDYGPCAFMDRYHPQTVFSSIDMQGRYAYDNQSHVIVWNMAQLASALVALMPDADQAVTDFTAAVHAMPATIERHWLQRFGRKIGLQEARPEDAALIHDLLDLMTGAGADFTNTFRALGSPEARNPFTDTANFDAWERRWQARLSQEADPEETMRQSNPAFIPRNHRIEQIIAEAQEGDFTGFKRLSDVLSRPYEDQPGAEDLTRPPEPSEVVQQTFCGT